MTLSLKSIIISSNGLSTGTTKYAVRPLIFPSIPLISIDSIGTAELMVVL